MSLSQAPADQPRNVLNASHSDHLPSGTSSPPNQRVRPSRWTKRQSTPSLPTDSKESLRAATVPAGATGQGLAGDWILYTPLSDGTRFSTRGHAAPLSNG